MITLRKLGLHLLINSISFFGVVCGSDAIESEYSDPYFCRTILNDNTPPREQLVAMYAEKLTVRTVDILEKHEHKLPSKNMPEKGNYLVASFFVAGNVGDLGSKIKHYREKHFEENGKSLLWCSPGINVTKLHNDIKELFEPKTTTDHTEPGFIKYISDLTDDKLTEFDNFMAESSVQQIESYGFHIESKYNICPQCIKLMYEYMTERKDINFFTKLKAKISTDTRRIALHQSQPLLIWTCRSFDTAYEDQVVHLHNGSRSFPMMYSDARADSPNLKLTLKPQEAYTGKLSVQFKFKQSDKIYFNGAQVPLPHIIIHPLDFFSEERRLYDNFSYRWGRGWGVESNYRLPDEKFIKSVYEEGKT